MKCMDVQPPCMFNFWPVPMLIIHQGSCVQRSSGIHVCTPYPPSLCQYRPPNVSNDRERGSETHPHSALNFHREGEMEGFPFSLPFLFPPRQTMRPFRLKTYPEVPLPALPSFSPLPVGLQYNLHGRRGMPVFSESNCCSIETTRIALHIFCLRRAEMEGGSAK